MMQDELMAHPVHHTQNSVYHHMEVFADTTAAVTAQGRHCWNEAGFVIG